MTSVSGDLDAAEAVIEEARCRQRRRRLLLIAALTIAAAASVAAVRHRGPGAANEPTVATAHRYVTPAQATRCLEAQHALVKAAPPIRDLLKAPAIQVSFALVPGQRLDALTISFERDRATAEAVVARLVRRFQAKVTNFRRYVTVENNVVISWASPRQTAASRSAVLGCL